MLDKSKGISFTGLLELWVWERGVTVDFFS